MLLLKKARIIGLGSHLPSRVLSNRDLEQMVDTTDEWILQRTGVSERRIAAADETTSTMGIQAARIALERAKVLPEQIDLILVATMSSDYLSPATASLIQNALGASQAAAVDIQAACSGYLYALSMAKAYIESGIYQTVLVVASEKMSAFTDYTDRSTCILFGDGASASVVTGQGSGYEIGVPCLGSDGGLAELITIPAGGSLQPASQESVEQRLHFIRLNGKEVFKQAVRRMAASSEKCLALAGLDKNQIAWLVPHQANDRIIHAVARSLEFPEEKIFKTVHKYGNTSASSVPIALEELVHAENLSEGDHLLLTAFGAGLTWGSVILTKI